MKKTWHTAALATTLALSLFACNQANKGPAKESNVIRIATGSPLSGGQANAGKDFEIGARLAVEQINAKGGVDVAGKKYTLELVPEDDVADPKTGATVAQKIVDDKSIMAVIGHYNSGVTLVASPIYAKNNIPSLTVSTNPDVILKAPKMADGSTAVFRINSHDGMQGPALAEYAQKRGIKNLAILDDATAFGKGMGDQVEKKAKELGLGVAVRESATDKTVDFKSILTKIKSQGADGIFWGGYDDTGAILAKQARELGLSSLLLMPDAVCTENYTKLAGTAAEGTICFSSSVPLGNMQGGAEFKAMYEKHFPGQVVQAYSPLTYDAVYALAKAIEQSGTPNDSVKIAQALAKVSIQGLSGTFAFKPDGERLNAEIAILEAKKGQFVLLETIK